MKRRTAVWSSIVLALAGAACSNEVASGRAQIPSRDDGMFTIEVLPVLLRDCGFQACHGSQERFLRVFGPGRVRLDPTLNVIEDPLTGSERDLSKQFALSLIDPVDPARSPLLRKPLAVEAGGAGHEGVDKYGRDIYRTADDDGYLVLARWVFSVAPSLAAQSQP